MLQSCDSKENHEYKKIRDLFVKYEIPYIDAGDPKDSIMTLIKNLDRILKMSSLENSYVDMHYKQRNNITDSVAVMLKYGLDLDNFYEVVIDYSLHNSKNEILSKVDTVIGYLHTAEIRLPPILDTFPYKIYGTLTYKNQSEEIQKAFYLPIQMKD